MITKVLLLAAAVAAVFVGIVALQPRQFRIERSVTIAAPAAVVFPHVNATRAWEAWSPWAKADPTIRVSYDGPTAGVGAATIFAGEKSGEGRSTIAESHEGELIRFRLDMTKPFASTSTADFTFKPSSNGTTVTWAMYGERNFAGKALGLLMNCDKGVGAEFEKGLNNLKSVVEQRAVAVR